jgi:group I intron endonuclease
MDTYKVTNTINGKFYIGSTVNFQERKAAHLRSKENYPFQNALRANPDAFEWEVWSDDSENRELEQALLDMWFGKEQCYNLNPNASVPPAYEWTEERRKAAGERAKKRGVDCLHTPQAIAKAKETRKNNPTVLTDEMRAHRSQILLGNQRKKGKKESQETRLKKSEAHKGIPKLLHKETMTGRTWWTHSDGRRKFQQEPPGPDWVNEYRDRKKIRRSEADIVKTRERISNALKGRKCWVNAQGEIKFQHESPGPEWQNGRVYRPDL